MRYATGCAAVLLFLPWVSFQCRADESERSRRERLWETYATKKYSTLNEQFNGELTPVFRALGDMGTNQYFQSKLNPIKYEAYRQFVVQVLADALHGDVVEAMFANVIIELTPPNVLLGMIARDIGPEGKLNGILDGERGDVAKHIQRQPQSGHIGRPNFIEYVRYLNGPYVRGIESQPNAEIIVDHMFRIDPQEAFMSMLWADYGFNPLVRGNCYLHCGKDGPEVRNLQLAHAEICDHLGRTRYSFPTREGQANAAKTELGRLAEHEKWWIRLYVARLIIREPQLRNPALIKRLSEDHNSYVQAALRQLAEEGKEPPLPTIRG